MHQLLKTEKAYIAGLVDCDGSIMIHKSQSVIVVAIYNTRESMITWLYARLGGYIHKREFNKGSFDGKKPLYMWRVTSKRCFDLLKAIYPFLVLKQKQADLAMCMHRLKQETKSYTGVKLAPEQIARRSELYELIRLANA